MGLIREFEDKKLNNNIKTALSKSKKGAKRYAAYLVLCDFFGIEPEEE
jgi:hypothetical protein